MFKIQLTLDYQSERHFTHLAVEFLGELKLNTVFRIECLVAQVTQAEQPQ